MRGQRDRLYSSRILGDTTDEAVSLLEGQAALSRVVRVDDSASGIRSSRLQLTIPFGHGIGLDNGGPSTVVCL